MKHCSSTILLISSLIFLSMTLVLYIRQEKKSGYFTSPVNTGALIVSNYNKNNTNFVCQININKHAAEWRESLILAFRCPKNSNTRFPQSIIIKTITNRLPSYCYFLINAAVIIFVVVNSRNRVFKLFAHRKR